jgi:hypothetical protein
MVINDIFDYGTIEIYRNTTNTIALLVGNSDRRLYSKLPIRGDSSQLRLAG